MEIKRVVRFDNFHNVKAFVYRMFREMMFSLRHVWKDSPVLRKYFFYSKRVPESINKCLIVLIVFIILITIGCRKQPFVPDETAFIFLQAVPPAVLQGETVRILITGEKASGYPLPDQTVVHLSADYGDIDQEVSLVGGRAEAAYLSPADFSGDAHITARCGNAQVAPEQLVLTIEERDIAYLLISADPPELPAVGGTATIEVSALDSDMNGLAGKTLWLETDTGTLSGSNTRTTGQKGKVEATLTTAEPATVSAQYKDITASVTVDISEPNQPPSAGFVYSPSNPGSGDTVFFNAELSRDEDGKIVLFKWDFGDGAKSSGQTVRHVYRVSEARTFVVVLKVVDDQGGEDVETREIRIEV